MNKLVIIVLGMFSTITIACEDAPYVPKTPEQTIIQVKERGVIVSETAIRKVSASGSCIRECMGLRNQCISISPPGFISAIGCKRQFNSCLETCQ